MRNISREIDQVQVKQFGDYVILQKKKNIREELEDINKAMYELMKIMLKELAENQGKYMPGSGEFIIKDWAINMDEFYSVGVKFEMKVLEKRKS